MFMAELPSLVPNRAMIGRWNVDQYIDRLRWPTIAGAAVTLLMSLLQWPTISVVIVEVLALTWTGWIVSQHSGRRVEGLTAGALVGLALGLAFSLGLFLAQPNVVTLISAVWQTAVTGFVGSLIVTSVVLIVSLRQSKP